MLALDRDGPAIYNIVDYEPAPLRDWLPMLAAALDAKPPAEAEAEYYDHHRAGHPGQAHT